MPSGTRGPSGDVVAILPFEHATTVSNWSGGTTNDGSASSVETGDDGASPSSGGTMDGGSSSGLSEEDEPPAGRPGPGKRGSSRGGGSVPLRKRFRSADGGGGITRRNLADHDVRMAEEMMNQDK